MAMTHRERVLTALDHREPDRIPIDFGGFQGVSAINVDAYKKLKRHLNMGVDKEISVGNTLMFTADIDDEILDRFDIDTYSASPSIWLRDFNGPETFYDKNWQITWRMTEVSTYSPVDGPFFKEKGTLAALEAFQWPKPHQLEDVNAWKQKVKDLRQKTDRAMIARLSLGIVTLAQILRGFEDWFVDLHLNRDFAEALLDKCAEIWIERALLIIDTIGDDADILGLADDYGFQTGPMLRPEMFRQMVTSRNKRMIQAVKAKTKKKILLHCCGSVFEYLDDFVEMGIDALNPIQVSAKDMDPVKIKERIGDRITLWGAVSVNDLVKETPKKVKEMVKRRLGELRKDGGYVLSATHNILKDIPPDNVVAMLDAALEYGKY